MSARKEMRPVWLIAGLSIAATMLFWTFARQDDQAAADAKFGAMTQTFSAALSETMTAYEQVLRAGVGLFNARDAVSDGEWRAFVSALELGTRYPGTRGVGYAAMFRASELQAHQEAMRQIRGTGYGVFPAGARETYSAVTLLEPQDEENRAAFGYDMYADEARRAAMMRAARSGHVSATSKVTLLQDKKVPADIRQAGVLIFAPVFKSKETRVADAAPEGDLRGFVYCALRVGDFMTGISNASLAGLRDSMRIELFDGEKPVASDLMFDSAPGKSSASGDFQALSSFNENGRSWLFRFTSRPSFENSAPGHSAWMVLPIGAALGFLLTALAASLAMRQIEEAEAGAQLALLTRELSHRVGNTLAMVQSIANRSLSNERSIAEGREIFTSRLHALARAHTCLLNNAWSGAGLRDIVECELSGFGDRIRASGPELALKPQFAQNFALLVHELASNALLHGSLSNDTGLVEVSWQIVRTGETPRLLFSWQESGGPPVRKPTQSGFGQVLLRQAFGSSGGRAPEMSFEETGFVYRVELELNRIATLDGVERSEG